MVAFKPITYSEDDGRDHLPKALHWFPEPLLDGGIYAGDRVLVYGEQGVGKSTAMGQIAVGYADAGINALLLTSELGEYELKEKMVDAFVEQIVTDAVYDRLRIAAVGTVAQFEQRVDASIRGQDGFRPRVVILDSLQGLGVGPCHSKEWVKADEDFGEGFNDKTTGGLPAWPVLS